VRSLEEKDSEITALKAKLERNIDSKEQLAAAETRVRGQAIEIATLEAQVERAMEGDLYDTDVGGPMTGTSKDTPSNSEQSVCPPGRRTPSASDLSRRLEAEETCQQLTTQCGTLCKKMESLQRSISMMTETYPGHGNKTDNSMQSSHWIEFEKQLGEVQREAEQAANTDSHTVYNEAVAQAHDLVIDLHQMERKELSARNDKNKILNLIEQHTKSCEGPKIFGTHTQYPNFLPQKDATLRGGR
jgi:hypothetical protein